ncbi:MAG: Jag N-terminal domain-containing protein [Desulfovibrio sp.]|nr:Jag N-terminal domain-containing protein [Desulfovibrio sp.]
MSEFNTFTGKTVDDAITEACRFFATERDKLEVEIITGGSTGIFGLMGKKKAQIRARRRLDPAVVALIEEDERKEKAAAAACAAPAAGSTPQEEPREAAAPNGQQPQERGQRSRPPRRDKPQNHREPREPRPERPRREHPAQAKAEQRPQNGSDHRMDALDDDLPEGQDQSPASAELIALTTEIMNRLLVPILEQEPKMEIDGTASRVNVLIQDEEHSGLLIGREGQTLAALQYLANRIVARRWKTPVRVQINTGEYREKQDDNLRKMALYLADKAKNLGRPQSTKPLSSYHRRVIHMALQNDETIQTRSKGDGPMKRVIIVPKRAKVEAAAQAQ